MKRRLCFSDSLIHSGTDIVVSLSAPLVLQNLLTVDLKYRVLSGRKLVHSGGLKKEERTVIHTVDPTASLFLSLQIQGFSYSAPGELICSFTLTCNNNCEVAINGRILAPSVDLLDAQKRILNLKLQNTLLCVHNCSLLTFARRYANGTREILVFAEFSLINKTGLPMLFKQVSFDNKIAAGQGRCCIP